MTQAYVVAVCAVMLFFVSLILHELGHALVARRLGIGISGIDLWFFGGVAKMSRDTDSPGTEFKIAAAGPAVTLVIIGICFGLGALISQGAALDVMRLADDAERLPGARAARLPRLDQRLALPLQPRAGVPARRRPARARADLEGSPATATARRGSPGRIGVGFAYLIIGVGHLPRRATATSSTASGSACSAGSSRSPRAPRSPSTAFTERLDGITVADIMDAQPVTMPATATRRPRPRTSTSCATAGTGFPSSTSTGASSGSCASRASTPRSPPGARRCAVGELVEAAEAERWRVPADRPLEALLGDERLRDNGALMAVDGDGVLRGVVTIEQVRRALTAVLPQRIAVA